MSSSARSVFYFGVYLALLGLTLLVAPNFLLGMFSFPPTNEVWVRIAGMLTFLIAFYYIQAARHELSSFFLWTVYARSSVILFFSAFVLLKFASPLLILFGVVDLLGAIWTWLTLRQSRS